MNISIITAKSGSALNNKNLINVCGNSLLSWQIKASKESKLIDDTYVSTDDKLIKDEALKLGVKVIDRPKHLAEPNANHGDVIKHACQIIESKISIKSVTVLLGNTAMVNSEDIDSCVSKLLSNNLFTGCMTVWKAQDDHPLRAMISKDGFLESYFKIENIDTNRQSYEPVYFYDQGPWTFRSSNFKLKGLNGPGPWWWMGDKCVFIERLWVTGRDVHNEFDVMFQEFWVNKFNK